MPRRTLPRSPDLHAPLLGAGLLASLAACGPGLSDSGPDPMAEERHGVELWRHAAFADVDHPWVFGLSVLPDGRLLVPWSGTSGSGPDHFRLFSADGDPQGELAPELYPANADPSHGAPTVEAWTPTPDGIVFVALAEHGGQRLVRLGLEMDLLDEAPLDIDGESPFVQALTSNGSRTVIVSSSGPNETRITLVDDDAMFDPMTSTATIERDTLTPHAGWLGDDAIVFGSALTTPASPHWTRGLWRVHPDGTVDAFVADETSDNGYQAGAMADGEVLLIDWNGQAYSFDGTEIARTDLDGLLDVAASSDGGWLVAPGVVLEPVEKLSPSLALEYVAQPTIAGSPRFVAADDPGFVTLEQPAGSRTYELVRYGP